MHEITIPNYRILETLGEGGMGVVYLANQERPVQRKVALKVIRLGMATEEVIARFESERQALAMMNHTGIAGIFDAGVTDDGRPYFAMEYVPGTPITDYCDRNCLSIRERLELFLSVCGAVHHAHQKAIIHRDLKPSNILVMIQDKKPVPKIIDFGVAKAVSRHPTGRTAHTQLGRLIGTPAYMSPEQAEMTGLNVDITTDVYSLGVILYELLVGVLPFDPDSLLDVGLEGIHRVLREVYPPTPSSRVSTLGGKSADIALRRRTLPVFLERQARGELDWITMRALEKDRTRRYQSAAEFAEDIERHLRNEPVRAGPPSARYRLRKFVQRHRTGVVAGGMVLLALIVGLVGTSIGFIRAMRAEERALQEAAAAQQVSDFLVGLFEVSDPGESRGNSVTAREVLDEGAERIRTELAEQPSLVARLMDTMGTVYMNLGLYEQARPLLEEALAIRRDIFGEEHRAYAVSLTNLASLLKETGDYAQALKLEQSALAIWERNLGPDHLDVALSLNNLGNTYRGLGSYDSARVLLSRSLAIRERVLGENHLDVASSLNNLANVNALTGEHEEAGALYERSLAIKERLLSPDHPDLALSLSNYANELFLTGNHAAAAEMYRRALAIQEKALGADHPGYAVTLNNLADLLFEMGEYQEAGPLYEQARRIWERKFGPAHPYVALSLHNLAKLAAAFGGYDRADQMYRDAQRLWEDRFGPDHPYLADNLEQHAELLRKIGRAEEAGRMEARAREIRARVE